MTVKDLTIGSPVYRVQLDSIDIARVRLIEAFKDGTRRIELTHDGHGCVEKEDASELKTDTRYSVIRTLWYINVEDAKLSQSILRSEYIENKKKIMEEAQNNFDNAIKSYAFSEPSTPKEL